MRTRFAPSPTGFLHIGGGRTALFCWLHTRRHGGTFLLRVEDTDRERSTQAAVDAILEGLHWLGLDPDEPPIFQSQRTANHLAGAHRLVALGKAYYCTCTRETLEAMREDQRARQVKPRYDGRCRGRLTPPEDARPAVIRFLTPDTGEVSWEDAIQGSIRVQNRELDDLILVRSDGSPTYNLAVVVDDHDMGITHVIRGEDHLSNTPRQIHLYRALGWPEPSFAHLPLLHGEDGAKLSKRHGAVGVMQYREDGYLPEALLNYLVRLGWSHGEQEIFSREEMIRHFDVGQVGRSAAIFNPTKLAWLNSWHLREASLSRLVPELVYQLGRLGVVNPDPGLVERVIPLFRERAKTLVEMAERARFFFLEAVESFDERAMARHFLAERWVPLSELAAALATLPSWDEQALETGFDAVLVNHPALNRGHLAQPVRVCLTGTDSSPGIFEVMALLGREQTLRRLASGLERFGKGAGVGGKPSVAVDTGARAF